MYFLGIGLSSWVFSYLTRRHSTSQIDLDLALVEAEAGVIWADTSEDLAKWENGQWEAYPRSPFCVGAFSLITTDAQEVWAGCIRGLYRWSGTAWREYGPAEGIADSARARIIEGGDGKLYTKTESGLYQYDAEADYWIAFPW